MNIKRGLIRLWVVGTILWYSIWGSLVLRDYLDNQFNFYISTEDYYFSIGIPIVFWILLYMGFWVSSGFSSNKKKDETNE